MKNKKILWICIGALDVAVVGFLFVIHIIMLINVIGKEPYQIKLLSEQPGLVGYLAGHLTVYGLAFVLPLFLILVANIIGLVLYLRRNLKREKITASDLTEEEKEALKKELLKDLQEK
ncbi:MAG: hypothetical protein IKP50_04490 [Bacilli bacterium]|nr:hypothetical protein [Bacilli bacterium]